MNRRGWRLGRTIYSPFESLSLPAPLQYRVSNIIPVLCAKARAEYERATTQRCSDGGGGSNGDRSNSEAVMTKSESGSEGARG